MQTLQTARPELTPAALAVGLRSHDRSMLARAITLIESSKPEHRANADELLQLILPETGRAHRIGITGVPGVGKSTTIDQFGLNLIDRGHRVAVLAVDPSSTRTGGSILGDKTRMARLAQDERAFIRPSPTSGTLGGVASKTRETMALCEAAGFDIILVETVGVGQSETTVADMVDIFVVLLLAGAGDDLQGIKKGVIEIADLIAINKADGDNIPRATRAAAEYASALHILTPADAIWCPPVITMSGLSNVGLDTLWAKIIEHKTVMTAAGAFDTRRRSQAVRWMYALLHDRLMTTLTANPKAAAQMPTLEAAVRAGTASPTKAASDLLALMGHGI
jgi:LAO/AO transport system kinase